jgi:hypothetical protein
MGVLGLTDARDAYDWADKHVAGHSNAPDAAYPGQQHERKSFVNPWHAD